MPICFMYVALSRKAHSHHCYQPSRVDAYSLLNDFLGCFFQIVTLMKFRPPENIALSVESRSQVAWNSCRWHCVVQGKADDRCRKPCPPLNIKSNWQYSPDNRQLRPTEEAFWLVIIQCVFWAEVFFSCNLGHLSSISQIQNVGGYARSANIEGELSRQCVLSFCGVGGEIDAIGRHPGRQRPPKRCDCPSVTLSKTFLGTILGS